jgi:hypothetical protein
VDSSQLTSIVNFVWGIADDVLRDLYFRGKHRAHFVLRERPSVPGRGGECG